MPYDVYECIGGMGARLKEARINSGLRRNYIVQALCVTSQAISHWEEGKYYPALPFLLGLCNLYHIPVEWVLTGDVPCAPRT